MLGLLLAVLVLLWFLGYITIPGVVVPNPTLFFLGNRAVTVINVLIFAIVLWLIGLLASPFREIAGVLVSLFTPRTSQPV